LSFECALALPMLVQAGRAVEQRDALFRAAFEAGEKFGGGLKMRFLNGAQLRDFFRLPAVMCERVRARDHAGDFLWQEVDGAEADRHEARGIGLQREAHEVEHDA